MTDESILIYESPDCGKTIYSRKSGSLDRTLIKEDPEFAEEHRKRSAEKYEKGLQAYILSGVHNHATFKGKTHTAEARKKISENRPRIYGEYNPSYGRIFLNDGKRNTSIIKEDLQTYLDQGWKIGRLKNKSQE